MRRYLFSLALAGGLLTTTNSFSNDNATQAISPGDAEALSQMGARIETVKYRYLQGETIAALPRNAAVKESGKYFVMASSERSLASFDRREFTLGDTWDEAFIEVASGVSAGDFILVKNEVSNRRTALTPTLVSAPKAPKIQPKPKPEVRVVQVEPVKPQVRVQQPVSPPAVVYPTVAVAKPIVKRVEQPVVIAQTPIPATPVVTREVTKSSGWFPSAVEVPCSDHVDPPKSSGWKFGFPPKDKGRSHSSSRRHPHPHRGFHSRRPGR